MHPIASYMHPPSQHGTGYATGAPMTMITRFVLAICGGIAVAETESLWLLFALLAIGALA